MAHEPQSNAAIQFIELFKAHGMKCVADVFTVRRPQHNSQFDGSASLQCRQAAGVDDHLLNQRPAERGRQAAASTRIHHVRIDF